MGAIERRALSLRWHQNVSPNEEALGEERCGIGSEPRVTAR
jgi:hypothetical protein